MSDAMNQVRAFLEQKGMTRTLHLLKQEINEKQTNGISIRENPKPLSILIRPEQ